MKNLSISFQNFILLLIMFISLLLLIHQVRGLKENNRDKIRIEYQNDYYA